MPLSAAHCRLVGSDTWQVKKLCLIISHMKRSFLHETFSSTEKENRFFLSPDYRVGFIEACESSHL